MLLAVAATPLPLHAEAVSQPAILQMFEARWDTIEDRMADIFQVGYGQMWLPPPQRADTGNQSVGYDVFDRFDLGSRATRRSTAPRRRSRPPSRPLTRGRQDVHRFYSEPQRVSEQEHERFRRPRRLSRFRAVDSGDTFGDFHDPCKVRTRTRQWKPVRPDRHRAGEEPPVHPPTGRRGKSGQHPGRFDLQQARLRTTPASTRTRTWAASP